MNLITKRILAVLIDFLIVGLPATIITFAFGIVKFILSFIPILNVFAFLFATGPLAFIIYTIYETFSTYLFKNTIGKNIMQIRVVNRIDYPSLSFFTCLVRACCKSVTIFFGWGILALVSLIIAIRNPSSSLVDVVVNTEVCEK